MKTRRRRPAAKMGTEAARPAPYRVGTRWGRSTWRRRSTTTARPRRRRRPRAAAWDRFFRVFFKTTPHRLMRGVRKVSASSPIEELVVVGRKTGKERHHLLSLIDVDGRLYVGHPNHRSQWARNLEAARRRAAPARVRADAGPGDLAGPRARAQRGDRGGRPAAVPRRPHLFGGAAPHRGRRRLLPPRAGRRRSRATGSVGRPTPDARDRSQPAPSSVSLRSASSRAATPRGI